MRLHRFALLLAFGLLTACAADTSGDEPSGDGASNEASDETGTLRIARPMPGAVLETGVVRVEGSAEVAGAEQVLVNGRPTPIEGGGFETTLELGEGPARIDVVAGELHAAVDITVDASAPEIVVETPEPATFVEGDLLVISGRVEDATEVELTVEEEALEVDEEGRFETTYEVAPGAHRFRLRARDAAGHVGYAYTSAITGTFAPADEPIAEALTLHVGRDALGEMGEGAAGAIAARDIEGDLMAFNPVVDAWWGEIHVVGLSHGDVDVALEPGHGQLDAAVTVSDVVVDFEVRPGIGGTIPGQLTASSAVLEAPVELDTAEGLPEVWLGAASATLEGFAFEMDWVPSFIEDMESVRNQVRTRVEDALMDAMNDVLPGFVEDSLADLPQGGTVDLGGIPVEVSGGLEELAVTPDGIDASLEASVWSSIPSIERSLEAPGAVRISRAAAPELATPGVGLTAAVDLLNSAAYAAWSSGAFEMRFDEPPYGDGTLKVQHLAPLAPSVLDEVPREAPLALVLEPELPVVMQTADDGRLELTAPDVRVEVLAMVDGEDVHLATVSFAVHAAISVQVVDDALQVSVDGWDYRVDPIEGPEDMPAPPMLEELLAIPLESSAERLLDLPSLPLPSLFGFRADAPMASVRDGHLTFEGTLTYEP